MQFRGKQVVAASGAVAAAIALAACSSSSSSSSSAPASAGASTQPRREHVRDQLVGERHHRGGRLDVPDQLPAGRDLRLQVGRLRHHRQLQPGWLGHRPHRPYSNTVLYAGSDSPIPPRRRQGSGGQDHAVLPGPDRPDRDCLQRVRRDRPEAGRDGPSPVSSRARSRPGTTRRSRPSTRAPACPAPRSTSRSARTPPARRRTSPSTWWTRPAAPGRSAPPRSSPSRSRRTPTTAVAPWRRSSRPPRTRSATWTSPPPPRPG